VNPGDEKRVVFTFDVEPQLQGEEATLSLSVGDRDLREFASEKVKIPIESKGALEPATGAKKAGPTGATLYPGPTKEHAFGRLAPATSVKVLGRVGDMDKLELDDGRFAFAASAELAAGGTPKGAVRFEDLYSHAPPTLEVSAGALATRADKVKLTGVASDGERLLDLEIFVGSRKLFYKSNRDGADPKRMPFEYEAPLLPGMNAIIVVARENADTVTRRVLVVRRDGPSGELLKTPKNQDSLDDWLAGDTDE